MSETVRCLHCGFETELWMGATSMNTLGEHFKICLGKVKDEVIKIQQDALEKIAYALPPNALSMVAGKALAAVRQKMEDGK